MSRPVSHPTGCALLGCSQEARTLHCECVQELPEQLRADFRRAFWAYHLAPKAMPANERFPLFQAYRQSVLQAQHHLREVFSVAPIQGELEL